jgi:membrane-bound lytic murein transglycosylase F
MQSLHEGGSLVRLWLTLVAVVLFALAACARIEAPQKMGELVVAVRNTPAFSQEDSESGNGFERDLIDAFASELGLKARFVVATDHTELVSLLHAGKVHLAASIPVGAAVEGVRYSPALRRAQQVLVRHVDDITLGDAENLAQEPIEVVAGSSIAATLRKADGGSGRVIVEQAGLGEIELLERVAERKSRLAATDMTHFRIAANYFPDLRIAATLPGVVEFAWGFAQDSDPGLFQKAGDFITKMRADGTLAHLEERYFGHLKRLNQPDAAGFLERMQTALPHFRQDFLDAQEITGIDWRLLAAMAYQESAWDPLATSPTGVRGIMMLTEETADRLNVSNRLDPRQSIRAGAKYLQDLIEQLPDSIPSPDKLWLGLAAYNLGLGHMHGARAIAASMKRNPDSWYDMKQVLPLMARPEYYARLKSGRARGGEAVIMVENIRSYYAIISRFEPAYKVSLSLR